MNMTQEMLEIMIGKHLDGEIAPSEQRLLEAELERSRSILAELNIVHEAGLGELARALEDLRSRAAELERELLQLPSGAAD